MPVKCPGCGTECNCFVSEDGYRGGHPELGRNFTTIQGDGSADNPYVFSFLDQMEFRPRTSEFRVNNTPLPDDSVTTLIAVPGTSTILYQSPINFIYRDPEEIEDYKYIQGNFFIIGASVTFAEASDSPDNARQLVLSNMRSNNGVNTPGGMAGQTTPGGNSDPLTLSCEALWAGTFSPIQVPGIIGVTATNAFSVHVLQRSGGPILLTDIRVWLTEV